MIKQKLSGKIHEYQVYQHKCICDQYSFTKKEKKNKVPMYNCTCMYIRENNDTRTCMNECWVAYTKRMYAMLTC